MKISKRGLSAMCVALVMGLAACNDPFDSSAGTPVLITASNSTLNLKAGSKTTLRATIVDAQRNALGTKIDATSDKPTLVAVDSIKFITELNETQIFIKSLATTKLDSAKINLAASGLTGVTKVFVAP